MSKIVEKVYLHPEIKVDGFDFSAADLMDRLEKTQSGDSFGKDRSKHYHMYHTFRQGVTVSAAAAVCAALQKGSHAAPTCVLKRVLDVGSKGDTSFLLHEALGVPHEGNFGVAMDDPTFEGPIYYLSDSGALRVGQQVPSPPPSFWTRVELCDVTKEKLPFADSSLDAVFALETLEHLQGVWFFMREVRRVLKPGGLFVITTPNPNSLVVLNAVLTGEIPGTYLAPRFHPKGPIGVEDMVHIREFSTDLLRAIVAFADLDIVVHTSFDYESGRSDAFEGLSKLYDTYGRIPRYLQRTIHFLVAQKQHEGPTLRSVFHPLYGDVGFDRTCVYDPDMTMDLSYVESLWPPASVRARCMPPSSYPGGGKCARI